MSTTPCSERGFTTSCAADDERLSVPQSGYTSTDSLSPRLPSFPSLIANMPAPFHFSAASSAPLPSPSASAAAGQAHYFAGQSGQTQARPALAQQQYASAEQQPRASRQGSDDSTSSASSDYLKDFSLVAEAAKRAQIAVLTRDLDDISL